MAGRSLILGPSLGTSSFVWSKVSARLAEEFSISSFELPGHGRREPASGPLTVADLADQVVQRADAMGVGVFDYAGISLCGAVGLELALRYPDRLSSLTVVCSAAKIGEGVAWRERAQLVRTEGTPLLVEGSAERWFAPGFRDRDPESSAQLLDDLSRADDASYAYLCLALADFDVRAELKDIAVPSLVLSGEHDAVTPPAAGQSVAGGIPGGQYATVSGASHLAPIEQPAEVARVMAHFLADVPVHRRPNR